MFSPQPPHTNSPHYAHQTHLLAETSSSALTPYQIVVLANSGHTSEVIPARSYQRDHVSRVQKRLSAQHVVRCWPKRLLLSVELAVGIGSPRSGHSLAKCPSLPQENHFGRGGGIGACLVIGGIPPKERQPVGGWPICRPTKMAAFTLS